MRSTRSTKGVGSYAVVWCDGDEQRAGRLELAQTALRLVRTGEASGAEQLEVPYRAIVGVHVGRSRAERLHGSPALVIERRVGKPLRVGAVDGVGIVAELADVLHDWVSRSAPANVNRSRAGGPRRTLVLLSVVEVLAMGLWFSASAVVPTLERQWQISSGAASWLTIAVQLGFVTGAVLSATFNLADRISVRVLISVATVAAALANGAVAVFAHGLATAVPLRFLTGVFLAGVYPPGMKLMASWFRAGRGLAIGVMIGALTLGSASPHLLNGLGDYSWRAVLLIGSALALLAAAIVLLLHEGPYAAASPPLDRRFIAHAFRDRPVRLANFGYFGHMWELYAMWAWLPAYLAASLGTDRAPALWAFVAIGVAGLAGSVVGGAVADRVGRTATTVVAMLVSGASALATAAAFGRGAIVVVGLASVWGFTVIADSAQFSTALTELADPRYLGSALTMQTAVGFLLTIVSIRLVPELAALWGWRWAFTPLALGPALGVVAMSMLRRDPSARKMARGAR